MRYFLAILLSLYVATDVASSRENVVSERADDVNITIYRDQNRGERPINARWPGGYALISEIRTITIKAGESQIRFEGVSEGMLPESAVVSGLPEGVSEKNRDERLLSPFGLVDSYLKRRVNIKRTSAETGDVTEKEVFITAGPNGGVIFESDEGFEALRCTGLPERMVYDKQPEDLSAKPTLSIITQSDRDVEVRVRLTYLASGFDWQANYIANVKSDAQTEKLDLFAWMTVANGGNQSFDNANLLAVAGTPNRENAGQQVRPTGKALRIRCWPQGRTHQIPTRGLFSLPPPPPSAQPELLESVSDVIVVTASKRSQSVQSIPVAAIVAEQENLGDLKLYRVPERVDVKAKGQKQVAMVVQPGVDYQRYFFGEIEDFDDDEYYPLYSILRSKNKKSKGLGLPLPSGRFSVFESSRFGPLLIGEGSLSDNAIDNDVELGLGEISDVLLKTKTLKISKRKIVKRAKVSNALNHPIDVEITIPFELRGKNKAVRKVDGIPTWFVTVPANGEAQLKYTIKLAKQ